jgi:hypothetical protein
MFSLPLSNSPPRKPQFRNPNPAATQVCLNRALFSSDLTLTLERFPCQIYSSLIVLLRVFTEMKSKHTLNDLALKHLENLNTIPPVLNRSTSGHLPLQVHLQQVRFTSPLPHFICSLIFLWISSDLI